MHNLIGNKREFYVKTLYEKELRKFIGIEND